MRYALRQLLKNPAFTLVAVLTLTLGIGANTAIFSIINSVLLRPLPFPHPNQLVSVWQEYPKRGWSQVSFSLLNFLDLRARTNLFIEAGAYALSAHTLTGVEEPTRLNTVRMSASLLPTLRMFPALGRNFEETEDQPGGPRAALMSDHLWRDRFSSDPAIVGRVIRLNDEWPVTVVGVLPPSFHLGEERPDLCLPLRIDQAKASRGQRGLSVIARLRSGVSKTEVDGALSSLAAQLREADPWANAEVRISAVPLNEQWASGARLSLLLLAGAVACVLLIACANVSNLLLARAYARRGELSIRAALGAGRGRIIGELLIESVILSLAGGVLGVVLAGAGVTWASDTLTARIPAAVDISVDRTVLVFTFLVATGTGVLCGLVPALSAAQVNLVDALKDGGKATTSGRARFRLRSALIAGEVGLAFVLLAGAGLLLKSLNELHQVALGFDPAKTLVAETTLAGSRYTDNNSARIAVVDAIALRLENLPGVEAVTFGNSAPLASEMDPSGTAVEGKTFAASEYPFTHMRGVRANFFSVLRVPLLEGRHLLESDGEAAPLVVVVNATLARHFWPGESALGKQIRPDALQTKNWLTVVGVVGDIKNEGLAQSPRPEVYFSYKQFPMRGLSVILRLKQDAPGFAQTVRREMRLVDGNLAFNRVQPMEQLVGEASGATGSQSSLLALFATLALLLAALGIYSVLACSLNQRTREMGIRLALGARKASLFALVLRGEMVAVLIGLGVGAGTALLLTRFIRGLLFQVSPTDPLILVGVGFLLIATASVACLAPARRATRINPIEVLRNE